MDEQIEDLDSQNQEEVVNPENDEPKDVGLPADEPEVEPQDMPEEDVEELKRKNQELYEQLKKAKGFKRDPKTGKWVKPEAKNEEVKPVRDSDITLTELHSLLKANVQEEDTQEVRLYARSHGISITDALKMEEVKTLLRTRAEIRRTAEATNVGSGRRGSSKPTGDALLREVREGKVVNSDKDISELVRARIAERKAKYGVN